jgi:hypothetical protein
MKARKKHQVTDHTVTVRLTFSLSRLAVTFNFQD